MFYHLTLRDLHTFFVDLDLNSLKLVPVDFFTVASTYPVTGNGVQLRARRTTGVCRSRINDCARLRILPVSSEKVYNLMRMYLIYINKYLLQEPLRLCHAQQFMMFIA